MRPQIELRHPHSPTKPTTGRSLSSALGLLALAGLLAATGCKPESPLPLEAKAASGLKLPREASMNRSAASCTNVSGTLVGNVFIGATVTGELEGYVAAYREPVVELRGQSVHLQTFHHFTLADGEIFTEDEGVQAPIDPPTYHLTNNYTIVRGTGAYEKVSGFIKLHATLITDFTGQHPENGKIDGKYHGRVCR